jgi:hypothetical protein
MVAAQGGENIAQTGVRNCVARINARCPGNVLNGRGSFVFPDLDDAQQMQGIGVVVRKRKNFAAQFFGLLHVALLKQRKSFLKRHGARRQIVCCVVAGIVNS